MLRAVAAAMLILAACEVRGAESIEVQLSGVAGESLWRTSGGAWTSTIDSQLSISWVGDEVRQFDLRPAGEAWFSTHVVAGDFWQLKLPVITVGQRYGAFQNYFYGGEMVTLPVVSVPEPRGALALIYAIAAVALAERGLKLAKGGRNGIAEGSVRADGAGAPYRLADGVESRPGVDERNL